jgi:hypothetical protein
LWLNQGSLRGKLLQICFPLKHFQAPESRGIGAWTASPLMVVVKSGVASRQTASDLLSP